MPNVKTKKFDWQIFLAVFCILLVIFCSTICCVFSYTNNGVAHADEPVFDTWNVTEGFYTKKITNRSDLQSIVNYYFSFIPEAQDVKSGGYIIGKIRFAYLNNSDSLETVDLSLKVSFTSVTALNYTIFMVDLYDSNLEDFINFVTIIDDGTDVVTGNYWQYYATSSTENYYFYSLTGDWTNQGTFLNQFISYALGSVSNFKELVAFTFSTYSTASIRWLVSQTDTFDSIPLPPSSSGGYDQGYQEGYDEGYQEGLLDNESAYNQGYNDGVLVGSQFYKDMTYREDVYRNNESLPYESFERNILDLTTFLTDAFDINKRWYWSTDFSTTSIGGGVLYYPTGTKEQFDNIGDVLTFYKENGNSPIYCIYDAGGSALHKFSDFNYIIDGYDFSILLNDGYALGYQQGINAGNKATEEQLKFYEQLGFDRGKLQGEQIGYENGYSDARENYINNDYSFFGLISSVLDAPLQVIVGTDEKPGMLNFYIPGLDINIAPFLLSLFTVALVITVIRFILARVS